ncbi:efflux RND transporter periplasmic adaptor subunit [Lacinutrix sp. Bg11-31]|uniref:efflux RND transporter periplasmic adaptor subunit n=1 Tax=Lacinutrix sp. Bg11-31 TaxID=2057808 RepID=UPI000C3168BD|nr:HlyD family efflux transporter periplasmic adaptor subunit [Lacinutrix sp. Bg11-31]AUC81145.1 efflux transporter periplasmic adaptor subunit [Lacinutrix sp. Bg11-31]
MHSKIIVILLIFATFSCSKNEEKILPKKRTITESVYTSATIQPDSLYKVYAAVAGLLDKNMVEEGAIVSKNQPIIQVINNTPKLNTDNAKLALDFAKENYSGSTAILDAIKDEISAVKLSLSNDSINFYRQKNLWEQKIGSKVQLDTKKLTYELSQNNLKLLVSKYNRTKKELQNAVNRANNNYKSSLITTKDFTVTSAINGKIYALYKESGEIVNTIEPLAAIGSAKNFLIKLLVDEVDIVKINKGQKTLITLDAYANEIFTGKISKIYPQKDERNQTFTLEAIFDMPPKTLYPGLSGEANIIILQKENALTIPKSYLIENNKVKTDNGIITIETGLLNMEFIEVLSGVTAKTYLYKPTE